MRLQLSIPSLFDKCLFLLLTAGTCFVLSGCGSSVTCTQSVDGGRLLTSLTEPGTSVDAIADATVQIVSACQLTPEQQLLIDKAVEKVAVDGSADLQAVFYSKLSASASSSTARVGFIRKSTLVKGTARSVQPQLSIVDFEHLGKSFDLNTASPKISDALKSVGLDNLDAVDLRLAKIDSRDVLLTRISSNVGFTEIIKIMAFDVETASRLSMPEEELDLASVRSDGEAFLEYFFDCVSLAGGICTVRDSRFAVDESGNLKYIASVTLNDHEGDGCGVNLSVLQANQGLFKSIPELAHGTEMSCDFPPSINDHGDPFAAYSEKDLQIRLMQFGGYPNLVQLLDFQRKDAGDEALRDALWAQGERWRPGMIEAAIKTIDLSKAQSAKSAEEATKSLGALHGILNSNLASLKWLISNPQQEQPLGQLIAESESKLEALRNQIESMQEVPKIPEPIESLPYPVEQVAIAIQREAQSTDDGVMRFPETPYVYIGARLPDSKLVLLYSQKPLVDRPSLVRVLASRGNEPLKYMINGFTRDVWVYHTLSEREMTEYQEHRKKREEYEQKVYAYKAFQRNTTAGINQLLRDIGTLDLETRNIAKEVLR